MYIKDCVQCRKNCLLGSNNELAKGIAECHGIHRSLIEIAIYLFVSGRLSIALGTHGE